MKLSRTEMPDGVSRNGEEPAYLRPGTVPRGKGEVIDIGSVGQRIRCRRQFPVVLQDLAHLRLLCLDLGIGQQRHQIFETELHTVNIHLVHDVKNHLCHVHLKTRTVVLDDPVKGIGVDVLRREPHAALLCGGHRSLLEVEEKRGYLCLELFEEEGIIALQTGDLANPVACLFLIDDDRIELVVGA